MYVNFLSFLACEFVYTFCAFYYRFYLFLSDFLFSIPGINSLGVLVVSDIFAQYVNFVYRILYSAGLLHFAIVTFVSPYYFSFLTFCLFFNFI